MLLEHLASADQRLRALFRAEARRFGAGRLGLEELQELGPGLVADQVATGVLERGYVQGIEAEGPAHRREAVVDPVEAEHRQLADPVIEFGLGEGIAFAQRLELTETGRDRRVVVRGPHAQLLELTPERQALGLGMGGALEELVAGGALAMSAEEAADLGEGGGAAVLRETAGLGLKRPQEHLDVVGALGDTAEILRDQEVTFDLVQRRAEHVAGEREVTADTALQEGEIAEDPGHGGRVVENFELLLEVGDQRDDLPLMEGDGLDRAEDREVSRGRLERRLVALQCCVAIAEVGLDQLAALAVEGGRLAGVTGRSDLLIEVANSAPHVSASEVDPIEEAHGRPEIRDQLEGMGEEAKRFVVLAAASAPATAGHCHDRAELRLADRRPREDLQHLEQRHVICGGRHVERSLHRLSPSWGRHRRGGRKQRRSR